jgi:enamine deaminase RidA (YjgF/YER057c/UK114 family)
LREYIPSPSPYAPVLGFSAAVKAGGFVAVSGTVGRRADGTFAEDYYEQTRQAIENIGAVLAQAGASLSNVVRTRMFVLDVDKVDDIAKAHREAFGDVMPASTIVEVSRLAATSMLIEIEVDAYVE